MEGRQALARLRRALEKTDQNKSSVWLNTPQANGLDYSPGGPGGFDPMLGQNYKSAAAPTPGSSGLKSASLLLSSRRLGRSEK
jgi:hypothetical protein